MADIPSGAGLGSSGTFTVGLLRAVYALKREHVTAGALAEEAARIEIDVLGEPVGKQDQYIAAFGGLTCFEFQPGRPRRREPARGLPTRPCTTSRSTCCCSSPATRARPARSSPTRTQRSSAGDARDAREPRPHEGARAARSSASSRPATRRRFGELMNEHWERKRKRSAGISNESTSTAGTSRRSTTGRSAASWSAPARGGFLLFYADDPPRRARGDGRRGPDARRGSPSTSTARSSSVARLTDAGRRSSPAGSGDPDGRAHRRRPRSSCSRSPGGRSPTTSSSGWRAPGSTASCSASATSASAIREFVGDGSRWGLEVDYVDEGDELRGTGGALRLAHRRRACSSPSSASCTATRTCASTSGAVSQHFRADGRTMLMCVLRNEGRWDSSNAAVADGSVTRYEKGRRRPGRPTGSTTSTTASRSSTATGSIAADPADDPVDLAEHLRARWPPRARLAALRGRRALLRDRLAGGARRARLAPAARAREPRR